ncbi:conserved hypothetical protein [Sporisorium reilianum SRZ2]|uniref:Uncharacterized protein n=1 Tax=Sporisorium reilianum (strain SRZ2) TaxID=999809 RepID=E6ZTZ2_SPORE|nr:conserved hypothetical protein [Sporisorium reilianum SRZ2]
MSISPSTSMSDRTLSSYGQLDDREQTPVASLESSAEATACITTFSDNGSGKLDTPHSPSRRLGRRPFQRLPIPEFSASKTDGETSDLELRHDCTPSVEARESEESFPQSPGNSPVSRFSPYQDDRSPAAVFARLVFGFHSRDKRDRNRSGSLGSSRRLHPSPPRAPRGAIALEPEDLVVPKKKAVRRKPIPASLFASAAGGKGDTKPRSFSVPDVFAERHFEEEGEVPQRLEATNSLGLFLPTIEATGSATGTDPAVSLSDKVIHDPVAWPQQQRLRRTTRSISDSRYQRRNLSVGATTVSTGSSSARTNPTSRSHDSEGFSDSSNSNSSSDDRSSPQRARTRSGSAPVYPSSALTEDARRYSIEESRPLRRVSRRKQGEMRSVFLSAPPAGILSTRHLQPLTHNTRTAEEAEAIEVLKTPEAPSQASFGRPPRASMSSPRYVSASATSSFDSGYARGDSGSECGSLGSLGSAGMSTASMLVLQQHIQMQNFQRQFGVDVAGPSADVTGGEEMLEAVSSLSVARAEADETEGERDLVQQYAVMRVEQWPSSESSDIDSTQHSSNNDTPAPAKTPGLRHMFSSPPLPTPSTDAETTLGSLRQRRAKPPIRIALAPSTPHSTFSANVIGAAIPLRKPRSRSILSPTTIHSPPPCPPPSTPLPQLPVPRSAPLIAPCRKLGCKRSFTRSSSTPVSPLDAPAHGQRGTPKCQSCTLAPAAHFGHAGSASHDEASTAESSALHTPPLTGGMSVVGARTPLSGRTDSSIATPLTAGPVGGKFDSLLAFLSSDREGGGEKRGRGQSKDAVEGGGEARMSNSAAPDEVVYGLAL